MTFSFRTNLRFCSWGCGKSIAVFWGAKECFMFLGADNCLRSREYELLALPYSLCMYILFHFPVYLNCYILVIVFILVLSRVKDFLPQLQKSNVEINNALCGDDAHEAAKRFDIEHLEDDLEKFIEMVGS